MAIRYLCRCGKLLEQPGNCGCRDRARPTTPQRGYGTQHQKLRKAWATLVAHGTITCQRCGHIIQPGEPWDLDHTDNRDDYLGPSHAHCNRSRRFFNRQHEDPAAEKREKNVSGQGYVPSVG